MSSLDEYAKAQADGSTVGHEWNRQEVEKLVASGFGEEPHRAKLHMSEATGEYWTLCNCGSQWSHHANQTAAEIKSIHKSHVAYFNRLPVTTL